MASCPPSPVPLPGVLILTTTPPLYLPTLLLSTKIRHPLGETFPKLITEQWINHLTSLGIEADAGRADPVVHLASVPSFPPFSGGRGEEAEEGEGSDSGQDDASSEFEEHEDDEGNVWRGAIASTHDRGLSTRNGPTPDGGSLVANVTFGQVTYLAPVPDGANSLLSLAFLHHFHSVISLYFPSSSAHAASASLSPGSLPNIPASVLSSNFDLLYQVLQEMIDDGRPLTTEYNSIKGIVRGRAWWDDIMTKMSSLTSSNAAAPPPPQISALPWRSAGATRYTRNEIFVDLVEHLSGTVDRKGKAVGGGFQLAMSIGCKAKLSGDAPDLTLGLYPSPSGPSSIIVAPSFHPCVRHKNWRKEGILSFVPPDGEFELANCLLSGSASKPKQNSGHAAGIDFTTAWNKQSLPFELNATRQAVKDSKGTDWTFEVRLTCHNRSNVGVSKLGASSSAGPTAVEGVEISFAVASGHLSNVLAPSASTGLGRLQDEDEDLSGTVTVDARSTVSSSAMSSTSSQRSDRGLTASVSTTTGDDAGTWRFDAREGVVRWTIPRLASGGSYHGSASPGGTVIASAPSEVTLKGRVTGDARSRSFQPSPVLTTYSLPVGSPSLSGLRVTSLQISNVDYKPFKGVRGATRGRIEWRW